MKALVFLVLLLGVQDWKFGEVQKEGTSRILQGERRSERMTAGWCSPLVPAQGIRLTRYEGTAKYVADYSLVGMEGTAVKWTVTHSFKAETGEDKVRSSRPISLELVQGAYWLRDPSGLCWRVEPNKPEPGMYLVELHVMRQ